MKRLSFVSALAVLLVPAAALAQSPQTAATLALTEGAVFLNDHTVSAMASTTALPDAAVVRTAEGRAAIALKRGGWLFLDAGASVRVFANNVYNFNRIEVLTGSAIVFSSTSAPIVECESAIKLSDSAFVRFDAKPVDARGERPCQFRIYEGAAAVPLTSLTVALHALQTMTCNKRCGDMIPLNDFMPGEPDAFEKWARFTQSRLRKESSDF